MDTLNDPMTQKGKALEAAYQAWSSVAGALGEFTPGPVAIDPPARAVILTLVKRIELLERKLEMQHQQTQAMLQQLLDKGKDEGAVLL